jgi:hypothetical protein
MMPTAIRNPFISNLGVEENLLCRANVHSTRKELPRFRFVQELLLTIADIARGLCQLVGGLFSAFCCGEHAGSNHTGQILYGQNRTLLAKLKAAFYFASLSKIDMQDC